MTFTEAGYAHDGDDSHDTPESFYRPIARAVGGFDLDPCASQTSDLADRNVTKDEDGLSFDWYGTVFMNPPYSDVTTWMEYANKQHVAGNTDLIVFLVYARTGTRWYHWHAKVADLLCFVKGRLTFGDGDYAAPAPSLVGVYGPAPRELQEHLVTVGHVVTGDRTVTQTTLEGWNADEGGQEATD